MANTCRAEDAKTNPKGATVPECTGAIECECWGCLQSAKVYPSDCGVHAEESQWVPADPDSNLCRDCREELAGNLKAIESQWDQVLDALQRGRGGGGDSERMGGSDIHPPLPIDLGASDAMRLARDAVWSGAHQLVMDRDHIRLPDDQSSPALAGWLARWHLEHLASHANGSWTVEWYTEIQQAATAIRRASAQGMVEVPTQELCKARMPKPKLGRAALGPLCGGDMILVERPDGIKVVRCSKDPGHWVAADNWFMVQQASRPQKRGARPPKL